MNIIVNDAKQTISPNASISQMLEELGIDPNGIAVAINDSVISKIFWQTTSIKEHDTILIIKASQGG